MLVGASAWVSVIAGVAGVLVGTAIGIASTLWAVSSVRADDEVAARLVADELRRVAGFLERCLVADVAPARFLEAARTSQVAPPLRVWHEHAPELARRLEDESWSVITLAMSEWPVLFDALSDHRDADDWPTEQRNAIGTLHRDFLAAIHAVNCA